MPVPTAAVRVRIASRRSRRAGPQACGRLALPGITALASVDASPSGAPPALLAAAGQAVRVYDVRRLPEDIKTAKCPPALATLTTDDHDGNAWASLAVHGSTVVAAGGQVERRLSAPPERIDRCATAGVAMALACDADGQKVPRGLEQAVARRKHQRRLVIRPESSECVVDGEGREGRGRRPLTFGQAARASAVVCERLVHRGHGLREVV